METKEYQKEYGKNCVKGPFGRLKEFYHIKKRSSNKKKTELRINLDKFLNH